MVLSIVHPNGGAAVAEEEPAPSHPGLFRVLRKPGEFNSCLVAEKSFQKGETLSSLAGVTRSPKAYSSVQCGLNDDDHMELNSDLVYINHSCEPNVLFDVSSPDMNEWTLKAAQDIEKGEALCFFYPSTEWQMDQPFECNCGTETCLKTITGAYSLRRAELERRGYINPHIWELVRRTELN